MRYLLDTNFVIGLLRGSETYWNALDLFFGEGLPAISNITRTEVYAGCHSEEAEGTRTLLNSFETIGVGDVVADLAGQYIYKFSRRGVTLHLEDAIIGATAIVEELNLVTQNVSHFPMLSLGKNLIPFPTR